MRVFFVFFFLITTACLAQNAIRVEVPNVPASDGKISVALYNSADAFLKFDAVFASESATAVAGKTEVLLTDIPEGKYAIALFYDKNANDELDTNWMGIPKEKVAFSYAKMKLFGPPSFKDCSFYLDADKTIVIGL